MPKTTAERMKKHCQNKAKNEPEFKKKESKRISDLQREKYASTSEKELSTFWEKSHLKVQAWRAENKAKEVLKVTTVTKDGFKMPQGFGKAMKCIKSQLPKSPSKKLSTVKGLVKEMGSEWNSENKAPKIRKKRDYLKK